MIDLHFIGVPELDLDYLEDWFSKVALQEGKNLSVMSVLIGTDDWLLELNIKYLNHDYYTDILTFDYCEQNFLSGDLFISIDRVRENSETYNTGFENELNRVLVHGLLHLCGYKDDTEENQKIMQEKEDFYLSQL